MRLRIDATKCQGYGACAEHVPGVIALDEWGYAYVVGDGGIDDPDQGRRAAGDCPVQAVVADDD